MSYIFQHTVLGFCWWDLPAFIVLVVVAAYFIIKHHNLKQEEKDLEDQLSGGYADDSMNGRSI